MRKRSSNSFKVLFFAFAALLVIAAASCDDSGLTPPSNTGEFSASLKPIDKNIEGVYELWASVVTGFDHDEGAYRSLGRFMMDVSGEVKDTSGGNFTPNLSKIPNINNVGDVLVTIQPPGYFDTIPSNIKIIGGPKNLQGSSFVFDLSMGYGDILPASNGFSSATAKYILASPTGAFASSEFEKGLWFSGDTTGSLAGLTLPVLSDTAEWTYQGWVYERNNPSNIYNTGRFDNPNISDGFNQCQGSNVPWQMPGQDWLLVNCPAGLPQITNLNSDTYDIMITLEPRFENAISLPFYIKLFTANIGTNPFGTVLTMNNVSVGNLPGGMLRLSSN